MAVTPCSHCAKLKLTLLSVKLSEGGWTLELLMADYHWPLRLQYELAALASFISNEIMKLFKSCGGIQWACDGGVISSNTHTSCSHWSQHEMCFYCPIHQGSFSLLRPQALPLTDKEIYPLCLKHPLLVRLSMLQSLKLRSFVTDSALVQQSVSVFTLYYLWSCWWIIHSLPVSVGHDRYFTGKKWVGNSIVLTHCHRSWVLQTWLSSQRSRRCCRPSSAARTRWPLASRTGCSSWWVRCAGLWSTWASLQADTQG